MSCLILQYTILLIFIFASVFAFAQFKVGNNPMSINGNAVLELESVNQGLLLPRLELVNTTTASPLSEHVKGMFVYNIVSSGTGNNAVSPGLYYNDGNAWVKLNNNQNDLIPKLTQEQRNAIISPENGLIIYNLTSNQIEFNAGSSASPEWIGTNVAQTPWMLSGTTEDAGPNKTDNIYRSGGVALGNNVVSPTSSALLELSSTEKGFLPPRMTEAQMNNIANPAEGLIIFCTDCQPKGLKYVLNGGWNHFNASPVYPPAVSNLAFGGNAGLEQGTVLTGTYVFISNGSENDLSTFKWYATDNPNTPGTPISTSNNCTLTSNHLNKWIGFEVTPKGNDPSSVGTPVIIWKPGLSTVIDYASLNLPLAFSLRKLRTSYAGPLIKVRRSSDNSEQDIYPDPNGNLDEFALTSFVGNTSSDFGYISVWYDQSTNGNHALQSTTTLQPIIVQAGVIIKEKNKPAIEFNNSRLAFTAIRNDGTSTSGWNITQYLLHFTASSASSGYVIARISYPPGGYGLDVSSKKMLFKNFQSNYSTQDVLDNTLYGNYTFHNISNVGASQSLEMYKDGKKLTDLAPRFFNTTGLSYIGSDPSDSNNNGFGSIANTFAGNISEVLLVNAPSSENINLLFNNTNFVWLGK